jgi:hypothetical protein
MFKCQHTASICTFCVKYTTINYQIHKKYVTDACTQVLHT